MSEQIQFKTSTLEKSSLEVAPTIITTSFLPGTFNSDL